MCSNTRVDAIGPALFCLLRFAIRCLFCVRSLVLVCAFILLRLPIYLAGYLFVDVNLECVCIYIVFQSLPQQFSSLVHFQCIVQSVGN